MESERFRPRARLIQTLGLELISSDRVALIELIKNAYDADATAVLVRFDGLDATAGALEVLDNGTGISPEVLRNVWLEPATPNRVRRVRSPRFGRRVLGEKGIGRFAASRLSSQFELVSRTPRAADEVHLRIDWTSFEHDNFLDEVEVRWRVVTAEIFAGSGRASAMWRQVDEDARKTHGTLLTMKGLRRAWTRHEVERLRVDLSRLISPFQSLEQTGRFEIYLDVPQPLADLSGRISPPEELKSPRYSLRGRIQSEGKANLQISLPGGRVNVRKELDVDLSAGTCGPIEVEVRVWDREASALEELATKLESSIGDVRHVLDLAAGISIFRDGFRVLPYGEPGNDWLHLDARRVQNPSLRISNNQLVGYVIIGSESNPQLRDQTNREGLIQGPAFDALRGLVTAALAELEQQRHEYRRDLPSRRERGRGLFDDLNVERIASFVRSKYPDDSKLAAIVGSQQRGIEKGVERVRQVLSRYVRYATLGLVVDGVIHDTAEPVGAIVSESQLALSAVRKSALNRAAVSKSFQTILNQANVAGRVLNRIAPFGGRKRGRPRQVVLENAIADGCGLLSAQVAEVGASIALPTSRTTVTADAVEIQEIVLNLLSNSLYWLRRVPSSRRRIQIEVERARGGVEILFADSGPGVDRKNRERIFEPYFSTKPDGSGLGLTIVGDLVANYYDGELVLLEEGPLQGATFRVTLRKRV